MDFSSFFPENSSSDTSGNGGDAASFLSGLWDNASTVADAAAKALATHIQGAGSSKSANPDAAPKVPVGQDANGSTRAVITNSNQGIPDWVKYSAGGILVVAAVILVAKAVA